MDANQYQSSAKVMEQASAADGRATDHSPPIPESKSAELPGLLPSPVTSNAKTTTKRKRSCDDVDHGDEEHPEKRRQTSTTSADVDALPTPDQQREAPEEAKPRPIETHLKDEEAVKLPKKKNDPVSHWIHEGKWPKDYFKSEAFVASRVSILPPELYMAAPIPPASMTSRSTPLTSGQIDGKSAPYVGHRYETGLAEKANGFLSEGKQGITERDEAVCRDLLDTFQPVPPNTLFADGKTLRAAHDKLHGRSEARVISDFGRLLVPCPENLATQGATELKHLVVSMNDNWDMAVVPTPPRPRPDFSVGFQRSAFTADQLQRFEPFVANVLNGSKASSHFLATPIMYFPFFTCESKRSAGDLLIADRQNANSMTIALRGMVELFRILNRVAELHRRILAFSISHNDTDLRIYGHYPIVDDGKATYHRHLIKGFNFISEEGKERWAAHRFTRNVYFNWAPEHLKLICSIIDNIAPNVNFEVSTGEALSSATTEQEPQEATSASGSASKKPRLAIRAMLQLELERTREDLQLERERNQQAIERLEENKRLDSERQLQTIQRLEESLKLEQSRQSEAIQRLVESHRIESERQRQTSDRLEEQNRDLMNALIKRSA